MMAALSGNSNFPVISILSYCLFPFTFGIFMVCSLKSGFQRKHEHFGYYVMIPGCYLNLLF